MKWSRKRGPPSYRQAASQYVARILKGTKPADLPGAAANQIRTGDQPQTAKALGLTVPPTLIAIADEIIE